MSSVVGQDALGSPPHTWRILLGLAPNPTLAGITSTHVENTCDIWAEHILLKDHLHTRGEYAVPALSDSKPLGSPPHTWRIRYWSAFRCFTGGITSTHVENTIAPPIFSSLLRDHLHTRGEYSKQIPI